MIFDDGYQFGIGAFETIAVYREEPVFIKEHLERLNKTLIFLGIERIITEDDLKQHLKSDQGDYYALKIMVSQKNLIVTKRAIAYDKSHYQKGFDLEYSDIQRNNTSPFVFHKTLNYGECIMEKRRALAMKIDEMIFLNFNGQLCEGTTCNIFFVKENKIYTPELSCGLLPGILRDYIIKTYDVIETGVTPEQIGDFDECFVTNSLMGVMPVRRLDKNVFDSHPITIKIAKDYFNKLLFGYSPIE